MSRLNLALALHCGAAHAVWPKFAGVRIRVRHSSLSRAPSLCVGRAFRFSSMHQRCKTANCRMQFLMKRRALFGRWASAVQEPTPCSRILSTAHARPSIGLLPPAASEHSTPRRINQQLDLANVPKLLSKHRRTLEPGTDQFKPSCSQLASCVENLQKS